MSMVSNVASAKPHIDSRQAPRARRHLAQAHPGAARRAVDLGGGRQGLRGAELVRPVRAGRHAEADRRPSAGRGRRDVGRSGRPSRRLAGEGAEPVASKPDVSRRSCATKSRNGTRSARPRTSSRPNNVREREAGLNWRIRPSPARRSRGSECPRRVLEPVDRSRALQRADPGVPADRSGRRAGRGRLRHARSQRAVEVHRLGPHSCTPEQSLGAQLEPAWRQPEHVKT